MSPGFASMMDVTCAMFERMICAFSALQDASSLQIRAGQTSTATARARQHLQSHNHAIAATRMSQTHTRALCHGEETAPELSGCHTNEPQPGPRHETDIAVAARLLSAS